MHYRRLKVSINCELCTRYYNQNDISNVLQTLYSSPQHIAMYLEICKGICQYWKIPEDLLLSPTEMGTKLANKKEGFEYSTPSCALSGNEFHNVPSVVEGENFASTESTSEIVPVSSLENNCKEPGLSSLDIMTQNGISNQNISGTATPETSHIQNVKLSEVKVESTMSIGSLKLANQRKEAISCLGGGCRNLADDCFYTGSSFKSQAYFNNYTHGDFAASASANLAIVSSEENKVSENHALNNNMKKVMSANVLLQVRAFSFAVVRFFWPNSEKKHVEVPRERCGWCLSCKAPVTSKKGCLLNAAASNAIKGPMKILAGLHPVKNGEGSLPSIATYIMFMEESLCGLTVGPFLSSDFRKQWRNQVEQATTCSGVKKLLLQVSSLFFFSFL